MLAELKTTFCLFPDRLRARIPPAGEDYAAILLYDDAHCPARQAFYATNTKINCILQKPIQGVVFVK